MSEIKTLLLLELRSFYGINKFLHTHDQKFKKRYTALSVVWIFLIAMLFSYVGGLVFGLCSLGLSNIVPAYLTFISSVIIILFGMFTSSNKIFSQKGYDILISMPLKAESIVISRFIGHYIADLLLTVAFMLPGITVYGICEHPSLMFYIFAAIGTIFIPAIPLVIATLFGTAIAAISSRMKNKSMAQSALSIVLVIGIMTASFSMEGITENFTAEQLTELANAVSSIFEKAYPPAIWINTAITQANIFFLLLFVFLSVSLIILTVFIISKNYNAIIQRLRNFTAKHNYKIGKMENRSLTKALYFREAKRYFSSSIYVTNTIIGPVLGTVMSVALCIIGIDAVKEALPIDTDIPSVLPFVFSAAFCMMTTTSVSISMEGKQFWIIKSLPISAKSLFDSKILFNLSLMLPFYIISQIAFAIAIKPSASEAFWILIIPILIMIFVVVFGITVNLKFHSFDWDKEEAVVKQSVSSAVGGFAGLFISLIFGITVFTVPSSYTALVKTLICIILLLSTILLYMSNNKKKLVEL